LSLLILALGLSQSSQCVQSGGRGRMIRSIHLLTDNQCLLIE
jgi:hypothetical protein